MEEIAVSFLLDQLKPFLQEEAILLSGVREDVVHIQDELEQMKAFLKVADAKEKTDPPLHVLVKQLRDVAYDTEDVLDEFMLRLAPRSGFYGFLHKIACGINNLKARHQIASEIRRIKSRVDNISQSSERFRNIEQAGSSSGIVISNTWHDGRGDALLLEEAELVGIEKPKQQIITWLLDGDSRLKVVSVVGMGGLGKTTLVKKVFEEVKTEKFQIHAWITVSQTFNIVELLKNMIKQLLQPVPASVETMNDNELRAFIKEFLQTKRYVVVLDDVWTTNAWDSIKYALPDHNFGSRVLLTTRLLDVANASHTDFNGYKYELKALSDTESWALFCNKTFQDKHCPAHLEDISRNILRKCEGLPLAIVAIGGVLKLKDRSRIDEWEMVHRNLISDELEEGNDKLKKINKVLSLSYYDLSYNLKICFLYLSLFPEDAEIEMERVIRLWTAERFVQEGERMTVEEVAEGYFNELLNRSLIQAADTALDGRVVKCRIHDLLREIALSKSRDQGIATVTDAIRQDGRWPEKVRRLAIHNSNIVGNIVVQEENNKYCFQGLRSLLIFGDVEWVSNSFVSSLLRGGGGGGSKLLKVLDLRGAHQLETIPDEVFELLHLRFLSMRNTKVAVVPKSIGKLRNLETLDLSGTRVTELPVEIGKLLKLRHLDVGDSMILSIRIGCFEAPVEIGNLTSLQELGMVDANHQSSNGKVIMGEIGKLTQLRGLRIANLRREDGMVLCSSLEKLKNLRVLTVASEVRISSDGEFEMLDLNSLSPQGCPPSLQKLYLYGVLDKVPQWISSLHSLTTVWLYGSKLRDDPLQSLQWISSLLQIDLTRAYIGEELCFKAGGFQMLKALTIFHLDGLKWVRVEQGAMPRLQTLDFGFCNKLEEISGIEHLTSVQSLDLYNIPDLLAGKLKDRDRESGDYRKIAHIPRVEINGELMVRGICPSPSSQVTDMLIHSTIVHWRTTMQRSPHSNYDREER